VALNVYQILKVFEKGMFYRVGTSLIHSNRAAHTNHMGDSTHNLLQKFAFSILLWLCYNTQKYWLKLSIFI